MNKASASLGISGYSAEHIRKQVYLWRDILAGEEIGTSADSIPESLYETWLQDIENTSRGYPLHNVHREPYAEDTISRYYGLSGSSPDRPAVVLTHDIDYLYPTSVLWLKKALGGRGTSLRVFKDDFIQSIERYLRVDRDYIGDESGIICIAAPLPVNGIARRLSQLVIDPGYRLASGYGRHLRDIAKEYSARIGIHGSYLSLENGGRFSEEKGRIEKFFGSSITFSRQHWLNINRLSQLQTMKSTGIKIDSSLGWNGTTGIRGGFVRPYPILLDNGGIIWELPMLFFDGILFDAMKLDPHKAFAESLKWLEMVKSRNGCIALNWHGRTFAPSYGWGETYERILDFCASHGFQFLSEKGLAERIENHEGKHIYRKN